LAALAAAIDSRRSAELEDLAVIIPTARSGARSLPGAAALVQVSDRER
jgi:hypothetical protein